MLEKFSPMEYKVLFLRKKPGSCTLVFPTTKDEGTVNTSDIVCIKRVSLTARTANIFSFEKDLSMYNVG